MKQPIVAIFGGNFDQKQKTDIDNNTTPYYFANDQNLEQIKLEQRPDVFASVGENFADFKNLCEMELRDRERWLHFKNSADLVEKMAQLYFCFVSHSVKPPTGLITIFTTSYKSKDYILRPFNSLRKQTYTNWEWIIFDDTDPNTIPDNFESLKKLKAQDPRIRIYRADKNSGIIGDVKNVASNLARGEIVIEVDHDDELTPRALEWTMNAFNEFPDAGFAYSDFSEILENGDNFNYSELFGVGYGSYRKELYNGKWRNVCCCPQINPVTIRYIVACPNHLRAWRRKTLQEIGGWNHKLHVADDFECLIRTFLHTKMIRIPEFCYIQYRNTGGNNFTFIRNCEIQKLVRVIAHYYNDKIHEHVTNNLKLPDPHHHDWENWTLFGKAWLNPIWEEPLNYISGKDNQNFSVILVVETTDTRADLEHKINLFFNQYYTKRELIIVGFKSQLWLPECLEAVKSSMVKWWLLEEGNRSDAINFACKMIARGPLIAYWCNEFEKRDYLAKIWFEMRLHNQPTPSPSPTLSPSPTPNPTSTLDDISDDEEEPEPELWSSNHQVG